MVAPHGHARIMIVDDEPIQLRTCCRVLNGHAPTEQAELAVKKGLTWLAKPYSVNFNSREWTADASPTSNALLPLQRATIAGHGNKVRVEYECASTTYPRPRHRSATRRCASLHRDIQGSQYVPPDLRVRSNRR